VIVSNAGWSFSPLGRDEQDEALSIRGYELVQKAQRELTFDKDATIEDKEVNSMCVVA
jgi:hypothetical protein